MVAGIKMAGRGEKSGGDLYAVMGLNRECSDVELRNAYKKLALRWHPDRCSASGNSRLVAEAKEKFQEIQEAYSVLSDTNKRFLYDIGVCNPNDTDDDEDENGMDEFLDEMAQMMRQTKPSSETGHESFEDLQRLFVDMFQADLDAGFGGFQTATTASSSSSTTTTTTTFCSGNGGGSHKRGSAAMGGKSKMEDMDTGGSFCFGSNDPGEPQRGRGGSSRRRDGRKQKVSSRHDVSSREAGISI